MKTILVPIDFSGNSKNALDYAIQLAKKLDMRLLLMHTHAELVEASFAPVKTASQKKATVSRRELENELKVWSEAVTEREKGLVCTTIFLEGDLSTEITNLVEEEAIDLVIMGTTGASGMKEIFVGSNTARVIEKVSCPVIAIPTGYHFQGLKKIVFATDYHDSDIDSLSFMVRLAKLFNSKLIVAHMAEGEMKPRFEEDLLEYFMEQVKKTIEYDKMEFHLLEGTNVSKTLNEFIAEEKADLFAISTKERILIGPLFNRGLTRKLAHHSQVPILAFHAFDIRMNDLFNMLV